MGRYRDLLRAQKHIINQYGAQMNDYGRAYNNIELEFLETQAQKEMIEEITAAVIKNINNANSQNAKDFAKEIDKALKGIRP